MFQKVTLILIFSCFCCISLSAYNSGENSKTHTVYVNCQGGSVRANVLNAYKNIHPKEDCFYYWFADNDIKSTQGGFDGKLLHGDYTSFYTDNNLKESGEFHYGLKTGTWKTWYPDGHLHEIIQYRNGKQDGTYEVFDQQGNMTDKLYFKNGIVKKKRTTATNDTSRSTSHHQRTSSPVKPPGNSAHSIRKHNTVQADTLATGAQDSIVKQPKSSFPLKKIFHKKSRKKEPDSPQQDNNQLSKSSLSKKPSVAKKKKSKTVSPPKKP